MDVKVKFPLEIMGAEFAKAKPRARQLLFLFCSEAGADLEGGVGIVLKGDHILSLVPCHNR